MAGLRLGFLAAIPIPASSPTAAPAFGANVIGFSFLLSTMIWVPVIVALVLAWVPNPRGRYDRSFMLTAFWTNAGLLVLGLIGYTQFQVFSTGPQFEERLPWMPAIGVSYHLGVDGIGMTVLLLSSFIGMIAVLASAGIRERVRQYFVLILLTQAAVNGVVAAQDFFVLFLFWGAATVPLGLLIAGWNATGDPAGAGGIGRAARFLAYWGLGTAALAAAGLTLYQGSGAVSFDFDYLLKADPGIRAQVVIAIALVIAAATRLPIVPFHSWIRDAYANAPVGVTILVAGSGARLGGYLLVRLLVGAQHDASRLLAPFLAVLAALTVVYAALAAWRAADLRMVAAYLAMIPGGVTVFGIAGLTALSLDGAVLSIFAGGIAAALITGAAATISERAQTASLSVLGGLAPRMPKLTWLWVIAALALLGAPFTGSFPALVMIFMGAIKNQPAAAFAIAGGLVIAAGVLAYVMYRALFGAANQDAPPASDSSLGESWYLGLLAGIVIWVGVIPSGPKLAGVPFFDPGIVNVVNAAVSDLAAPYAPPSR